MSSQVLFYIIISITIVSYLFDNWLELLNHKYRKNPLPESVKLVYDKEKIIEQETYHRANFRLEMFASALSFVLILSVFLFNIIPIYDKFLRSLTEDKFLMPALFFLGVGVISFLISLPFSAYTTFVIEQKFGFNKTTIKTFVMDILKSTILILIFGSVVLYVFVWFLETTGTMFWLWIWAFMIIISLFLTMFYSNLIVPLFNKQKPLPEGELRTEIEMFSKKCGFKIKNIYLIDASKRSTKTNAYFTGLGAKKRIVLYDNLLEKHSINEIVAILAHEIGHYKKKHTQYNLVLSIIQTGLILFILSFFINNPILSQALGVEKHSFYIGLISFGILFEPISEFLTFFMSKLSRKFEYQADNFVKKYNLNIALAEALKKLSKDNLSNINPHPLYVKFHYSHPPLHDRLENLKK